MIHAAIQNALVPVVGVLATKAGLDLGFFIGLLGCSACVIVQLFFPVRTISLYPRPSHPTHNALHLRTRMGFRICCPYLVMVLIRCGRCIVLHPGAHGNAHGLQTARCCPSSSLSPAVYSRYVSHYLRPALQAAIGPAMRAASASGRRLLQCDRQRLYAGRRRGVGQRRQ
jgi:hypothetical protein